MKGLMIKDIRLLRGQQRILLMFALIAVISYVTGMDNEVLIGYLSFMFAILSITTLTYDEYDNGLAFLMTLPVTKREYVIEKYVFCFGMSAIGGAIGVLFSVMFHIMNGNIMDSFPEILVMFVSELLMVSMIIALTIPFVMKFGAEKGRLLLISVTVCLTLLFASISKVIISHYSKDTIEQFMDSHILLLVITSILLLIIGLYVSFVCAFKALEHREL